MLKERNGLGTMHNPNTGLAEDGEAVPNSCHCPAAQQGDFA